MWIEEIRIGGFGRWRDRLFRFRPGSLNLFLDDNAEGKTTLLQALLGVLFGLHVRKGGRRYALEEEEIYRPWDAGAFAAAGKVHSGDEVLEIRRDFEERSVEVHAGGDEVTERFRRRKGDVPVGAALTGGLDRDLFLKTFCVTHRGLERGEFEDLADPIEQALASRTGETTAEDALAVLRSALDDLGREVVPVDGANQTPRVIRSLQGSLQALERERGRLLREAEAREEARLRLLRETEDPAELEEEIARTQLLRDRAALEEAGQALSEADDLEREAAGKRTALDALSSEAGRSVTRDDLERLRGWVHRSRAAVEEAAEHEKKSDASRERALELEGDLEEASPGGPPEPGDLQDLLSSLALARRCEERREKAAARAREAEERLRGKGVSREEALWRHEAFRKIREEEEFLREMAARTGTPVEPCREAVVAAGLRLAAARWHRSPHLWTGVVCAATGGFLGLAAGEISRPTLWIGGVLAAGGLGLCAWGLSRALRETGRARQELEEARAKLHEAEVAEAGNQARMASLADRSGIPREDLPRQWRYYESRRPETLALIAALEDEEEAALESREEVDRRAGVLRRFAPDEDLAAVPRLQLALQRAERARGIAEDLERAREAAQREGREAETARERGGELLRRARALVEESGVEVGEDGDPETWIAAFERTLRAKDRAAALAQEIPPLEARAAKLREQHPRERMAELEEAVALAAEAHPSWRGAEPEASADEYESRLRGLRGRMRAAEEAFSRHDDEILEAEVEFRKRWDQIQEEIPKTERKLRRARAFSESVGLALRELETISRDLYRIWSKELNPLVERHARNLVDEIRSFAFDEGLGWRLEMRGGRIFTQEDQRSLSHGVRARMLLALRLGLVDYLGAASPDGSLPLLLDDPFVDFDDPSLARAVTALLESAERGRQIFLFTCSEVRLGHISELLGDRLESSVHRIDPDAGDLAVSGTEGA